MESALLKDHDGADCPASFDHNGSGRGKLKRYLRLHGGRIGIDRCIVVHDLHTSSADLSRCDAAHFGRAFLHIGDIVGRKANSAPVLFLQEKTSSASADGRRKKLRLLGHKSEPHFP